MKKNVYVFDDPEAVIHRFTVIKDNGDGYIVNASPFSFSKSVYGFFGNVLHDDSYFSDMEDLINKAKCDNQIFGKFVADNNFLPDEVIQYIDEL